MAMNALRKGASGGLGKFVLFGLLALAAAGLVLTDAGGFFRNGVGGSDIARAGDRSISIQEFDRTLRRTIAPLNISVEQANQMGYLRQILNSEIRGHLMAQAARDHGVQIAKPLIAEEIHGMVAPLVQEGQSAHDVLEQLLAAQGMSERELVKSIDKDMSVSILGGALDSAFTYAPDAMTADLAAYLNETRSITYLPFPNKDFTDVPEPTEEDLQNFYEVAKEAYAKPESRSGQLILISTQELQDTLDISEDEIRNEYDANIDFYTRAETREISQSILRSEEVAQQVASKAAAGGSLKKAVNEVTGNTTDFIPARELEKDELLEELQDPVFSAEKSGDIVGPVKTALGYHVLAVENIIEPHTVPFEEAKDDIRNEIASMRLGDVKYETANMVDDMLAAGQSPEEVQEELGTQLVEIPFITRYGTQAGGEEMALPENLQEDIPTILETLYDLQEGESSPVFETADGNMAALYVEAVQPKTYAPYEEVKPALSARWINDQKRSANRARVEALMSEHESFEALLDSVGRRSALKKIETLPRQSPQGAAQPLPPQAVQTVFNAKPGQMEIIDLPEGPAVVRVDGYSLSKVEGEQKEEIKTALTQSMQNEALALYIDHLSDEYHAMVNERLLDSVYNSAAAQ